MSALETMSVAVPVEMATAIRQAVQAGEFASQDDAVQDAIRAWTYERVMPTVHTVDELRILWNEAIASETDGLDPDEVFDQLEAKYSELIKAQQS